MSKTKIEEELYKAGNAVGQPKVKKKVSFGKAHVRVLLNYYREDGSSEEMSSNEVAKEDEKRNEDVRETTDEEKAGDPRRKRTLMIEKNKEKGPPERRTKDFKQSNMSSIKQARLGDKRSPKDYSAHGEFKSILKKRAMVRVPVRDTETKTNTNKLEKQRHEKLRGRTFPKKVSSKDNTQENNKDKEDTKLGSKSHSHKFIPKTSKMEKEPKEPIDTFKERPPARSQNVQKPQNQISREQKLVNKDVAVKDNTKNNQDIAKIDKQEGAVPTRMKNNEKWPGAKTLGLMGDFQIYGEVYNGVEANWTETKKALSKIGVDIEEDKLQSPSEFIAVMSLLLDMKTTGKLPVTKTNTLIDKKTGSFADLLKNNGDTADQNARTNIVEGLESCDSKISKDLRGLAGTRWDPSRRTRYVEDGVNNLTMEKHEWKGLRRSNSDGSLATQGKLGLMKGIKAREYYSVEDVRGISKSGKNTSKWHSVLKRFWNRIKKKKSNTGGVDKSFDENSSTEIEKEYQVSDIKELENNPTLLCIAKQFNEESDTIIDKTENSEVDQERKKREISKETWKSKSNQSDETNEESNDNSFGEAEKVEEKRRNATESDVEATSQVEASEIQEFDGVKEASGIEEAIEVEETIGIEEAIKLEESFHLIEAIEVEEVIQVKKASKLGQASLVQELTRVGEVKETTSNLAKEASVVKEGINLVKDASNGGKINLVDKACQVDDLNEEKNGQIDVMEEPSQIGPNDIGCKDGQTDKLFLFPKYKVSRGVQIRNRSQQKTHGPHSKKPNQNNSVRNVYTKAVIVKHRTDGEKNTYLFFAMLSKLPGHELCAPEPLIYRDFIY